MSTVIFSTTSYGDDEQEALAQMEDKRKAAIACRDAIEAVFGSSKKPSIDQLTPIMKQYGYQRTAWVLANTLYEYQKTEEFGRANLRWARQQCHPFPDDDRRDFLVRLPATTLNRLASLYKQAYRSLPLFDSSQCLPKKIGYQGKVVVLKPDVMQFLCADPEGQLWYAISGEGCKANQEDADLLCASLADGSTSLWTRRCFSGVLKDEFLPEWAKPKLAELKAQEQTDAPTMGGMNMK